MNKKFRIRRGDKVIVTAGRSKGKSGEVVRVLRSADSLIVSGVNMVRKHVKSTASTAGSISERESPIHISSVAMLDPKLNVATRVGYKFLDDGRKVRFAKKSGEVLDK